jgi:hypothetical protein
MWGRKRGVNLVDTPEMDAFFARLGQMDQAQVMAITAAWKSVSREEHEDAWTAIRALGERDGLTKEIDRVRDKVLEMAARGTNSVPYMVIDFSRQMRIEAGGALVEAALAVALGSRLDSGTHDLLLGPWLRVFERER